MTFTDYQIAPVISVIPF